MYDELYIVGSFNAPEIFLSFYDPTNICEGKCRIGDLNKINREKRQLYAIQNDMLPQGISGFTIQHKIFYPSGQLAFVIGSFTSIQK